MTATVTAAPSALSFFKYLSLAGVLKKRFFTIIVVPSGQPAASKDTVFPASSSTLVPVSASLSFVVSSTRLTEDMAARASPRKPRVAIASSPRSSRSLLVAWRRKAIFASSGAIPQPLSVTRMKDIPPPCISTVTLFAPASIEFSQSSFTTEAGRSTTSPAAIRSARWGGIS